MAQRVVQYVEFTDDLNGQVFDEHEGETVRYSIDGAHYEIDLTHANATEFRDVIGPYLKASRRAEGPGPARPTRRSRDEMARIRAWGRDNGFEVSDMGKIPQRLLTAYERAQR